MNNEQLYDYLIKLQSITKIGLLYSTDPYAISNYKQIEALTKELLEQVNKVKITGNNYFTRDIYPTPNISVRTIIWNDHNEFLMVQEKEDNGFSFPGGWCDLYDAPSEAAIRESREEGGVEIKLMNLVGIFNRTPFKNPVSVPEYVIVFNAKFIRKVGEPDHEIIRTLWVNENNLPKVSDKVTREEILMFLQASKDEKPSFS